MRTLFAGSRGDAQRKRRRHVHRTLRSSELRPCHTAFAPAFFPVCVLQGVRMFQFTNNTLESIVQIIDTALLFLPELINPVDAGSAARNLYFMKVYASRDMEKRPTPVVTIDESTVQSGDFLGAVAAGQSRAL